MAGMNAVHEWGKAPDFDSEQPPGNGASRQFNRADFAGAQQQCWRLFSTVRFSRQPG
jgi:hypothetical protein